MLYRLKQLYYRLYRRFQKRKQNIITKQLRKFYAALIRQGDLCFDVGANVGERTAIFLALGAKVIAIEPQPHCVEQLEKRYQSHADVIIVPKGLASKPATLQMYISDTHTLSTFSKDWQTGRFKDYQWKQTQDIEVTTLDDLIEKFSRPKFCKIDVEGFEFEVLQGLSSPIEYVSLEFDREFIDKTQQCIEHLETLGYRHFNFVLGDNLTDTFEFVFDNWQTSQVVLAYLNKNTDKRLWGDVYAHYPMPDANNN